MRMGANMRTSQRFIIAVAVFFLLGGAAFAAYWYQSNRSAPDPAAAGLTINVTQGGDRGPGSLREALFIAAAANGKATIAINVPKVSLASALPPLVNVHGMRVVGPQGGVELDAHALGGAAVIDVAGPNISVQGIAIRNCSGTGVLLRATRFRLEASTIEACDVAIDVAENAADILIERNRFVKNRVGIRFAASSRNAAVVKNDFSGHADAAVWAVRSTPDLRDPPISVRDNRFIDEPIGVLVGNIAMLVERNEFRKARTAAVQLIGEGAVVRGNRISGGAAMGIVAENARSAIVDKNEIDHLTAYGIMVKTSSNTLVRGNRLHNCGYGMAFVLGDANNPSTAVENTVIEPKYNGIDVIGDSPILRRNHVLRPRVMSLNVADFTGPDGRRIRAKPFLDGNTFGAGAATVAAGNPPPANAPTAR
jgi:parallel beta-helix repeat protein